MMPGCGSMSNVRGDKVGPSMRARGAIIAVTSHHDDLTMSLERYTLSWTGRSLEKNEHD